MGSCICTYHTVNVLLKWHGTQGECSEILYEQTGTNAKELIDTDFIIIMALDNFLRTKVISLFFSNPNISYDTIKYLSKWDLSIHFKINLSQLQSQQRKYQENISTYLYV